MKDSEPSKFGTFKGVYTPSVLTILGVILYLRMGWVLGNVGLTGTLVIVTLASAITFLTGLSIAATATNMRVGGGGAYFMVSRSFGVEAGAAIGLPLYVAQALGISFYLAGFAESVVAIAPWIPARWMATVILLAITGLSFRSTNLALRVQYIVFGLIVVSLVTFVFGQTPEAGWEAPASVPDVTPFWQVFAVFFPAVTGILAGISMSGDLKDASRSLPVGTIAAVVTGWLVYMVVPIILTQFAPPEVLRTRPSLMQEVALFGGIFVLLGLWAATLSSALGSLLAAPRTMQAMARDGILPSWLAKSSGSEGLPRTATLFSFAVALVGIWLGDLDAIAPVLSMFFLTAYGFLNLIAGLEGVIGNPSWRPKFRIHWIVSLAGAAGCFATMVMINPGATMIAAVLQFLVFLFMRNREMNERWDDTRRSLLTSLARYSVYRLANYQTSAKTWRPNLLVLTGSPTARWHLVELADALTHGKGFMTIATILPKANVTGERLLSLQKSMEEYLAKRSISSLVKVQVADDILTGAEALVRSYGLGPIVPNTLVLGETQKEENFNMFAHLIRIVWDSQRNVVIVRQGDNEIQSLRRKRIDVWWGGLEQNAGLMLALGYMLQTSQEWGSCRLTLKSVVQNEKDRSNQYQQLANLIENGRVEAEVEVHVASPEEDALATTIQRESADADFVFIGLRVPSQDETEEEYAAYYKRLLERTANFPPTGFVLGHETVRFREIFGDPKERAPKEKKAS